MEETVDSLALDYVGMMLERHGLHGQIGNERPGPPGTHRRTIPGLFAPINALTRPHLSTAFRPLSRLGTDRSLPAVLRAS